MKRKARKLQLEQWRLVHIKEGLLQAQQKQFVSDRLLKSAFARWRHWPMSLSSER